MRYRLFLFCLFVAALVLLPVAFSHASAPGLGGTLEARIDGQAVQLPLLKTDVDAQIQGDLATVTVTQTFANPHDRALHARYLFPLSHDAAVFEMVMEVGDERIRAQIQETKQAEKTFAAAKREGKAAALLKEHRPNMFTQEIANLMPGLPVTARLRYVQTVPKVDGAYELSIPLVVGPRFQPLGAGRPSVEEAVSQTDETRAAKGRDDPGAADAGEWELEALPAYPPVHGLNQPPAIDPERVALSVRLDGGVPVQAAESRTHALDLRAESDRVWSIGLAGGRVIDNRDFVLRYRLAGSRTQAGLLAHRDGRGGFFSLLIEPPQLPAESEVTPREMVFLLDCSGSMFGLPMEASKAFMRQALARLRPTDSFRIVRFSDDASEFTAQPLPATPANVARGLAYTEALQGEGGTMMSAGIEQALAPAVPDGSLRIVTFLTDGYIGNEHEILKLVRERLDGARLYTFGVGAGVNRYLLDEIGRAGRGFTRYMDPTEDVAAVAAELADKLQSPLLTDIVVDWGGLHPTDVFPEQIPDLFAGQSVRVQGRFTASGTHTVVVQGLARGRPARMPVTLTLPAAGAGDGDAIALVWARSAIRESMYRLSLPRHVSGMQPDVDALKRRVTDLGLTFSLLTKWTSFVAVSEKVYNASPEDAIDADVPLPMVAGVSARAYPDAGPAFTGAAGPEPAAWAAMVVLMALAALALRARGVPVRRTARR